MKSRTLIAVAFSIFLLSGCSSFFTFYKEIAIDKVYVPKQCPTFDHQFEIPGKKYKSNDVTETTLVTRLDDLTISLARNTKAREIFNNTIIESNKETMVKDTSFDNPSERVVKRVYVDRECPKYYYSPEFTAKKLTPTFTPEEGVTYVVITLDNMVFQMEKHKKEKDVFNGVVDDLNSKPFPFNFLSK